MGGMSAPAAPVTDDALYEALSTVIDPEIRKPVTELGMVEHVSVDDAGRVAVTILLTVSGCPMKETLTKDTTAALARVDGVTGIKVTLGVMSDEHAELVALRRRNRVLEMEVEILKRASAYFARENVLPK